MKRTESCRTGPFVTGLVLVLAVSSIALAQPDDAMKATLAWQIALDRAGFSPGLIDGKAGPKTLLATREYQRSRGLTVTGQADAQTSQALQIDAAKALATYTIRPQDNDEIGPAPKSWMEKSKLPRLAYQSLAALVGEKFHCSQNCLAALNGGKTLSALKAGDTLNVPNAATDGPIAAGKSIVVSFAEKVVRVYGEPNHMVGMFHCSIAADKANLPTARSTTVAVIKPNPEYRFDPKMWPEVKDVDHVLIIPPGPRNPVGLCWMGLALPGYGMHGTPAPDLIGKTGSHGCFRLTNWDAVRMSKMIREGTPVAFVQGSAERTVAAAPAAPSRAPARRAEVARTRTPPSAPPVRRASTPGGWD